MNTAHDYAAVLNALVERVKEIGCENQANDVSLACYQILETAISEAEVWDVPLDEIGLGGYETVTLLTQNKRVA